MSNLFNINVLILMLTTLHRAEQFLAYVYSNTIKHNTCAYLPKNMSTLLTLCIP